MSPLRRGAAALVLLFLSLEAFAAEGPTADAARLLELTQAERLAVPVYAQVHQLLAERAGPAPSPAERALLERYQARADGLLDQAIGWKTLEPELVALYTQAFSADELRQLVVFYESPLGRKMLDRLPALNMRSAQLAQARVESVAPRVRQLMDEMSAELKSNP